MLLKIEYNLEEFVTLDPPTTFLNNVYFTSTSWYTKLSLKLYQE